MQEASAVASKVCAICGSRYPADALFCPADGAPLQSAAGAEREVDDPYLGLEISGHIEIRQLVGVGAMGRVYRAFQRGIDRDVAVKILHRELSANAQLVSRFTREAKVASRLQHPNVVQVLLAGQLQDRALYMVMEYLDGLSLQSALAAAGGALPLPRALHVALQLAEATGEAHAQGIVHRDLKPENVMLVRRGSDPDFVKVLDYGIARFNWGETSVATAAGLIFGTARYISPEGAQGNAVGPASDVYAMAILLYQMLSGRTPFEGDQAVGLLVQQIHDKPPPLRSIPRAEYVPESIARVVMANLAKDPADREVDARAFGQSLLDAAKQAGLSQEDISRPLTNRRPSAMQLPPVQRTKQLELSPDLAERLTPPSPSSAPKNGADSKGGRQPMGPTVKWEPPSEFQARLASAAAEPARDPFASDPLIDATPAPAPAPSRPRTPSTVDETMDDATANEPLPRTPTPVTATPSFPDPPRVPRTIAEEPARAMPARATQYAPQEVARQVIASEHEFAHGAERVGERRSKGVLFVVLCFVIGAALAAGVAWKMGKLGGDDREALVTRATEAMYKNRFVAPPGDNVRDITDDGLRRWPNDRRLVDVRVRAANELVTQALTHRSAGDIAEALKIARIARELDPGDTSAKRLVDQYEAELAAASPSSSLPLPAPVPNASASAAGRPQPVSATVKTTVDVSAQRPRIGQTVELTARVVPAREVGEPMFVVTGPGAAGVQVAAVASSPGVYRGSHTFGAGGRFEIVFQGQADGKAIRATRALAVGAPAPAPAPQPVPAPQPPQPPQTPPQTPTSPAPTPSVKWL